MTASGSFDAYAPEDAVDGAISTYWQASTVTGWLAVGFPSRALVDEFHVHFLTTSYPSLSLSVDTNGNGIYETTERVWSTGTNKALDVTVATGTLEASGVKVTIDEKVGNKLPKIGEFEVYLRNDSDGDGLTNDVEAATTFYQDMAPGGMPIPLPDDGLNAAAVIADLAAFGGFPHRAFAQFVVDHPAKSELVAFVGYWNGTVWIDRPVWDPGLRGLGAAPPLLDTSPGGGGSSPSRALGTMGTEWPGGEVDAGTRYSVVVDLTAALGTEAAAEIAAGIHHPGFTADFFMEYRDWRLVVFDATAGGVGQIVAVTLRFEALSDPIDADSDDDSLSDRAELTYFQTLPVAADSDVDGLSDDFEVLAHDMTVTIDSVSRVLMGVRTNPTRGDTDADGLGDGYEVSRPIDPSDRDTDDDGLEDGPELTTYGSDPARTDSDGDTILDSVEVAPRALNLVIDGAAVRRTITTLPYAADSDGDGIPDDAESSGTSNWGVITDPADPDTDDDGIPDGAEAFIKEFGLGGRAPLGAGGSRTVTAYAQCPIEAVEVRYGISGTDLSSVRIRLDHEGAIGLLLRNGGGSGFYVHESLDITAAFPGMSPAGAYTLVVEAPAGGAVLEEFSIRLRVRISPIAADTDLDAIRDREELEYGLDGYLTDPSLWDTDGDGWSDGYEVSRGTSPRYADTDADGVADPADVDPLLNMFVAVTVYYVHHGSPGWTPTLQAVVEVNGDYVYATPHVGASQDFVCTSWYWDLWSWSWQCGSWMATTAAFYTTYYADVPDNRWDVSVKVQGWSINPLWQDDLLVDRSITYWHSWGAYGETAGNGGHWISWQVNTVRLDRVRTLAITDGQITVRDQYGADRYPSEERFTLFLIRASYAYGAIAAGLNAILVPEGIFANTHLKARLDGSQAWPLDGATFYDGDSSKASMSEGIAGLVAGDLGGYEAWVVLQYLLQDSTGTYAYQAIDASGRVTALNLPQDVVRIIPWIGLYNAPTGPMPEGNFWAKAWNGLVTVGQLVYGGLIAIGTFFVQLGEAIVAWGMRAMGLIANVINEVKASVDRAVQAIISAANWIRDLALNLFQALIDRFVDYFESMIRGIVEKVARVVAAARSLADTLPSLQDVLNEVLRVTADLMRLFLAIEATEVAVTAVVAVLSGGAAALVKTAVAGVVRQGLLQAILRSLVFATVASLAVTIVDSFDEGAMDSHLSEIFKRIVGGIAFSTSIFRFLNGRIQARGGGLTQFADAAGLALLSLVIKFFAGYILADVLVGLGVQNPFAEGFGLLVLDTIAFIVAGIGLLRHFFPTPLTTATKIARQSFLPITDGVETVLTFSALGAATASILSNLRDGTYGGQPWAPSSG